MMEIRTMIIEDYPEVYDIWINTPGMGLNDIDDSREGILKYLKRNPTTCFVACDQGRIVGAILSGHDGRRGYISHTAVKGDLQKQGIGTLLVNSVLSAMEAEGITKIALVVFGKNEKGNNFWQKQGFTTREDLIYRNKAIKKLVRMDT